MRRGIACHGGRALPFLLFILGALLLAASGWAEGASSPAAFRDKLYDVDFVSATEAWAVGYPGLILHTTDAGATWTRLALDEEEPLFAVDFVDAKSGWIVGRSGLIYATTDGGKTWAARKSGVAEALSDVDFFDAAHGIAVGNFGTVLTTQDGGKTWASQVVASMESAGLNAVRYLNATTAFFAGEYPSWETDLSEGVKAEDISSLWRTGDGGATWTLVRTGVEKAIYDVVFVDERAGYACGSAGTLLATDDGGATWKPVTTPLDNILVKMAVVESSVFVAGTEGVILRVAGDTVQRLDTNVYTWLGGVDFGDPLRGIAVGARGTILHTADGGKTWAKQPIK
jgi:photosystem II stability/assembly factor-like uncharacterized protein